MSTLSQQSKSHDDELIEELEEVDMDEVVEMIYMIKLRQLLMLSRSVQDGLKKTCLINKVQTQ